MEMEALALCIGHLFQMPSMPTEESDQAIEPRKRCMYARSVPAQLVVLEASSKVWLNIAPGALNQILTTHFAFQFHPVLQGKSQDLVYALIAPLGPSIALVEPPQKPRAVLAKFLMLVQQLVYGIIQQSVELVHISIHLLHRPILTAQLVPQVIIVWEVLLPQLLAVLAK